MKTIEDYNKWEEKHTFEYNRVTNARSFASHTTPNRSIIEEHIIRGSLFKPVVNIFILCYSFKEYGCNIDLVSKYNGSTIVDPYSIERRLIAAFEELSDAWLFAENEKINLLV